MSDTPRSPYLRALPGLLLLVVVLAAAWWFLQDRETWPRGEALGAALRPIVEGKDPERALVARVVWENYLETRANASRWSGLYWGLTFLAAVFSALAAVGQSLLRRHMAIVGGSEQRQTLQQAAHPASAAK